MVSDYSVNVFYNCPFDDEYQPIFEAVLFTIYRCNFNLRCAREFNDTGKIRIDNIVKLIRESNYGIHDLCRVELDSTSKLPRFNMPLELGIFIGAIKFGGKTTHAKKEYLILDSESFRFKSFISDIGGQDIKSYTSINSVIRTIRDWLSNKTERPIPSATYISDEYAKFLAVLPELCANEKWVREELTYKELISLTTTWIELNRK